MQLPGPVALVTQIRISVCSSPMMLQNCHMWGEQWILPARCGEVRSWESAHHVTVLLNPPFDPNMHIMYYELWGRRHRHRACWSSGCDNSNGNILWRRHFAFLRLIYPSFFLHYCLYPTPMVINRGTVSASQNCMYLQLYMSSILVLVLYVNNFRISILAFL
jgi:hypothetical protein